MSWRSRRNDEVMARIRAAVRMHDDLVRRIEADVEALGQGPAVQKRRPVDRAKLVVDAHGWVHAVVKPVGGTYEARDLHGRVWTPRSSAAA